MRKPQGKISGFAVQKKITKQCDEMRDTGQKKCKKTLTKKNEKKNDETTTKWNSTHSKQNNEQSKCNCTQKKRNKLH